MHQLQPLGTDHVLIQGVGLYTCETYVMVSHAVIEGNSQLIIQFAWSCSSSLITALSCSTHMFSSMGYDNVNNDSANGIQQVEPLGYARCDQPNGMHTPLMMPKLNLNAPKRLIIHQGSTGLMQSTVACKCPSHIKVHLSRLRLSLRRYNEIDTERTRTLTSTAPILLDSWSHERVSQQTRRRGLGILPETSRSHQERSKDSE
ncbi:hypothetical protein VNO77_27634 [Canavalia gladiata]|uniref:Uncharacterized protein n=1 Tax=Canavalia gladiata TaxID=3824 RepID=A0AAN9KX99_CANGL